MKHLDELPSLRLQPASRKAFIPFDMTDKRKGAAILLLSPNEETSYKIMNLPYIYNPQYFTAYYLDRKVDTYINKDNTIANEELKDLAIAQNEAMMHSMDISYSKYNDDILKFKRNIKFDIIGGTSMDKREVLKTYNVPNYSFWADRLKMRQTDPKLNIYIHSSLSEFEDYLRQNNIEDAKKYIMYSYSDRNNIHILSRYCYLSNIMDGPYETYLLNELISYMISVINPNFNKKLINAMVIGISGQYPYLEKNTEIKQGIDKKCMNLSKFFYNTVVINKKWNEFDRFIHTGNINPLKNYMISPIKDSMKTIFSEFGILMEDKLSVADKKNLDDSDYGLPDKKKYPMPDESHVRSAIRFFNHVSEEDEEELAKNINKKIKEFNMKVNVGKDNRFYKYYNESALNENMLINREDLYFNMDQWEPNGKNILYITGISGSGKTTLSRELGNKYNAEVIELDLLFIACFKDPVKSKRGVDNLTPILLEYWNSTNHTPIIGYGDPNSSIEISQFINWMNKNYSSNGKLYIIEGCEIAYNLSPSYLVDNPLIIKGTSSIISMLRRGKRSYLKQIDKGNRSIDGFIHAITDIKRMLINKRLIKNELQFQQFEELLYLAQDMNESTRINDKGKKVPDVCPECGSKVYTVLRGEPIYICSNPHCKKYFGTVPFKHESVLLESFNKKLYNSLKDVEEVINKIPKSEKKDIGDRYNGNKGEDLVIFRKVINKSAFIEIYKDNNYPGEGAIVIGASPDARGRGYTDSLINDAIRECPKLGINKLCWKCDFNNKHSYKLALRNGFIDKTKKDYTMYWLERELSSTIREAKEPTPTKNGFYSGEGRNRRWNSILTKNGKNYRERVECLIIKGDTVFVRKKNGIFIVPGGSTEPDKTCKEQCIIECQQEVHITPKNLEYMCSYYSGDKPYDSHYDGYYTHVFVGEYDKKYTGYVAKEDRDTPMLNEGGFYPIDEAINDMIPEHVQALEKYLTKHKSIIQERYIISDKDKQYNLDKWVYGKNILFITGLSGGGKSTHARQIAFDYHATYIELDNISNAWNFKDNPSPKRQDELWISEFIKKNNITKDPQSMSDNEYNKYLLDCMKYIFEKAKKDSDNLYVFEGIQIIRFARNNNWIFDYPMIIKGTSVLKSILNRKKRENDYKDLINKFNIDEDIKDERGLFTLLNWYMDQEYSLRCLRKAAKSYNEAAITESSIADKYIDLLDICDQLTTDEFKRISFHDIYEDSEYIIYRDIIYDNEKPIGFLDVYVYPSTPRIAQITAAVIPEYRGMGAMTMMLKKLIHSDFAKNNNIGTYVWNVHPDNIPSARVAEKNGFVYFGVDNGYGAKSWVYETEVSDHDYTKYLNDVLFKTNESTISEGVIEGPGYIGVLDENNKLEEIYIDSEYFTEAAPIDSKRMRKFLYQERIKTNAQQLEQLKKAELANPWLKRIFVKLDLYKEYNIFIDMSYYHSIFLKNNTITLDRGVKLYFDFLNKMINNKEYDQWPKKTIYIPLFKDTWGPYTPDIYDYKKRLNILSMIARLLRKEPDALSNAWGNKIIIFVGDNGYFRVDFSTFTFNKLSKFKKLCDKLLKNEAITQSDLTEEDDDIITVDDDNTDSTKAIVTGIVNRIEDNTGIRINNIATGSSKQDSIDRADHLRIKTQQYIVDDPNSTFIGIIAPDKESFEKIMYNNIIKNSNEIINYVNHQ